MAKFIVEVKATEVDIVSELISCLSDHFNELPEEVQQKIKSIVDKVE